MKKFLCRRCDDYFNPRSHWAPFELSPRVTPCYRKHPVATSFEMRAEITARKLFGLAPVVVFLVSSLWLVRQGGLALGLVAAAFLGLLGGSILGLLLYMFAAVPLQLLIEGGAAVGGAVAGRRGGKPASGVTDEERRLLEHVQGRARPPARPKR